MLPYSNKNKPLRILAQECLLELATEEGINASGKDEIYGCIFGRDSAITVLKILKAHSKKPSKELLKISRRTLLTLISLQGKESNIESGEELGKFIHEFRKEKFEHLMNLPKPWYVYPDNTLRNYDSIDSTPLTLIAIFKYFQASKDYDFLFKALPSVEAGLNWIITYGDRDKDFLLEYELPEERTYGGLLVQSWTDSHESLLQPNGQMPKYPIAPVEAQGYAWLALKLWASFYIHQSSDFAQKLYTQAQAIKRKFNESFIIKDNGLFFAAQALDGEKRQIRTVTGNPLLLLWASYSEGYNIECIIENKFIKDLVKRAFMNDLFDKDAGIRTMSSLSETYNPNQDSYHNGSYWPVLNGMAYEGLVNWNYSKEALMLKKASIKPLEYFGTPIELYTKGSDGQLLEYKNERGQVSCRAQAWSAAALLDLTTDKYPFWEMMMEPITSFQLLELLKITPKNMISLGLAPIKFITQNTFNI